MIVSDANLRQILGEMEDVKQARELQEQILPAAPKSPNKQDRACILRLQPLN